MAKTQNYSAETRAKAVRLVREHAGDYPSEWAAIGAVAQRLGIGSAETLRKWLRQAETDEGSRAGRTTEESAELRALKRKVRVVRNRGKGPGRIEIEFYNDDDLTALAAMLASHSNGHRGAAA